MSAVIRADTDQLRTVARQMREIADLILSSTGAVAREMDSFAATWSGSARERGMARWAEIQPRYQPDAERLSHLARELDALADRLEDAARVFGDGLMLLGPEQRAKLDAWRAESAWSVVTGADGQPILRTGRGEEIHLGRLAAGDAEMLERYRSFMGNQALVEAYFEQLRRGEQLETAQDHAEKLSKVLEAARHLSEGRWQHVSGYLKSNGTWVEEYWRSVPEFKRIGKSLGFVGDTLDVVAIGSSLYQHFTDDKGNRWISIPLGQAGDTQIVYNVYEPPKDHLRDVIGGIGGIGGGMGGAAGGRALGALTSPFTGPVGTAVGFAGGGYVGSEAGEAVATRLYDRFVPPPAEAPIPPTRIEGKVEGNTLSVTNDDTVTSIDVGRLGQGGAQTSLQYQIGPDGRPYIVTTTTATF